MIAKRVPKTDQHSSYQDLAGYILDRKGGGAKVRHAWATHCSIPGDLGLCIKEVMATQQLNTRSKNDRTYHLVVSLPSGEDLTKEQFRDVEDRFCHAIGLGDHQRICAVHTDTGNIHMHIALSKVHPTRLTCVEPFYDKFKLQEVCREIEQVYGLKKDAGQEPKPGVSAFESRRGIESFLDYIRQNFAPEFQKLLAGSDASWEGAQTLAGHFGIEIRERGAGFVFSHINEKLFVKASSVDPAFSKSRLESVLGSFELRNGPVTVSQSYEPRPFGKKPESDSLYAEFLKETRSLRDARYENLSKLYELRSARIAEIKQKYAKRRLELRSDTVLNGAAKSRVRQKLAFEMKKEIEACFGSTRKELDKVRTSHVSRRWREWLLQKANQGSERALDTLRAAAKSNPEEGHGKISGNEVKPVLFRGDSRNVLPDGTVEYRTGNGSIIDIGSSLIVKDLSPITLQTALRMGQAKFGTSMQMEGSVEFMSAMNRLLSAQTLNISGLERKDDPRGILSTRL